MEKKREPGESDILQILDARLALLIVTQISTQNM